MLPKTAGSAHAHKSLSFIWIVWSTLYVYLWLQCNDAIHRDYPFKCTIATTRAYRINCTQTGYLLQENFLVGFLDSHFSTRIGKVLDNFLVHKTWKIHAGSSIWILNTLLFHFNESVNKKCQEVAICDLHVSGECDERDVILALHKQGRRNGQVLQVYLFGLA